MPVHPEIASHVAQEGTSPVRLHGGPWDGKEVHVHNPHAPLVQVNGPRQGRHYVWITHLYELRGGRYEFVRTEETAVSEVWDPRPPRETLG
jgi:hypothetical protein